MNAPICIDDLGHAKIRTNRHQRDGFVFAQLVHGHEEPAQLAERVTHRAVETGVVRDLGLRVGAELGEIVGIGKAIDRPGLFGLQHRMSEPLERRAAEITVLVEDKFKIARERCLDRGTAEFAVALRGMRIADREERAGHRHRIIHPRALPRRANHRCCRLYSSAVSN